MTALPPAMDVLPAEVRALLGPLQARAETGCAASAAALQHVMHLSHVMTLPAPRALREAAPGLLALATRVAEGDPPAGAELEAGLARAFAAARAEVEADLATLEAQARAVATTGAAFAPAVAALLAHQGPTGSLAASVTAERARVARDLEQARAVLDGGGPLAAAIEAVERARWGARFFPARRPVVVAADAPWIPLGSPGAPIEVINTAYYRARGHGIYEDFKTQVGEDPTVSRADAVDFARRLQVACAQGVALPEVLGVVETGIGSGQFAQAFLDALEEGAPDLYRRVRYHLCDVSPVMLEQAQARPALARHRERLVAVVSNGLPDALPGGVTAVCCRFYELFTDLPETDLVYRDAEHRLFRTLARGVVSGDEPMALLSGPPAPARDVAAWLAAGDVDRLSNLAAPSLARLDWEGRLDPMNEDDLPAPADALFFGQHDLLLPIPLGGARALQDAVDLLDPALGWVRLSDYAFVTAAPFHRGLPYVAQLLRRYGGNITLDLHAPLLAGLAAGLGLEVQVTPLSGFVSRVAGGRFVPIPPYYARYGAANLLRHVSGDDAVLPLEALVAFEPLRELALHIVRSAGRATPDAWDQFLSQAAAAGWLDPGLPLHDARPGAPLLASLSEALDPVVNGVLVRAGAGPLRAGRAWWSPPEVAAIVAQLTAIGFDPDAARRALDGHADRVRLWTLTAARR